MSVNASSSPLAARRNRTSSLSCSAILISPDKTFCSLSSVNSLGGLEKFPFARIGAVLESRCFHNRLDVDEGFRVSKKAMCERVNYRVRSVKVGAKPLFFGLEHACGNFGDEATRHKAFTVSAEIVSEARDDVTLAGSQSFQARMRDFFGGFGVVFEFFLTGNSVEFRLRRAWTKSAYPDSVRFHLFGKPFREKQVKSFRGSVSGNIRNGLERSRRR